MTSFGVVFQRRGNRSLRDTGQRLLNSLYLRGPKYQNQKLLSNCVLCAVRGDVFTPEDLTTRQPVEAGGRWHLVFSGFLNHREDLAAHLEIQQAHLSRLGDADLALRAWQKWGTGLTRYLFGSYALIVHDQTDRQITAIRSPFDGDIIYYHAAADTAYLASAPSAIFAASDLPREIDETKISDTLVLNYEDAERSYFKDINILPLGHTLIISPDQCKVMQSATNITPGRVRFKRDSEYVDHAWDLLSKATKSAMRGIDRPAALLSSGLDSSSVVIAALAELETGKPLKDGAFATYTHVPMASWDGRSVGGKYRVGDESGPVRAMAAMYPQLNPHFVASEDLAIDNDYETLFLLADAFPFGVKQSYWVHDVFRTAASNGHKILLGGTAGNASLSFGGKMLLSGLFRQGKLSHLYTALKTQKTDGAFLNGLYTKAIEKNLPRGLAKRIASLRGVGSKAGRNAWSAISPEYAEEMRVDERAKDLGHDDSFIGPSDRLSGMDYLFRNGVSDFSGGTARASRILTGVRTRYPLQDEKLIEYCLSIPDEQFCVDGEDRSLIKRMMAGRLPPEILTSPRGRQAADWHTRMTRDLGRFRQEVDQYMDDPDIARRIDVPRLKRLLDTWPDKTPLSAEDHPEYILAKNGLLRAIMTARFINWVNGKNYQGSNQ